MERRSERRLPVELPGSYRTAASTRGCSMFFSQLSSKGCRVTAYDLDLAVGDAVHVHLGAIGPLPAAVRWRAGDSAGVEFGAALDAEVVSYFAAFINDAA